MLGNWRQCAHLQSLGVALCIRKEAKRCLAFEARSYLANRERWLQITAGHQRSHPRALDDEHSSRRATIHARKHDTKERYRHFGAEAIAFMTLLAGVRADGPLL